MKFINNTKFDTQQLRGIVAAVVNRYLTKTQRKYLEITINSVRTGGRFKWVSGRASGRWAIGRLQATETFRPIIALPNDLSPQKIAWNMYNLCRRWGSEIRHSETSAVQQAWQERVGEMPLEEAAPKVVNKKDPLGKAEEKLESSKKSSATWKNKLLKAANKVQDYDKKVKYYKARIVLIKRERIGEIRKKKAATKKDGFRIVRHRKDV
jgi:hypothetical protein